MIWRGRRRDARKQPDGGHELLAPGEYGRLEGVPGWYGCTPYGHLANLSRHDVEEHDDGTISVSPSILVVTVDGGQVWHGYLVRGVWREY